MKKKKKKKKDEEGKGAGGGGGGEHLVLICLATVQKPGWQCPAQTAQPSRAQLVWTKVRRNAGQAQPAEDTSATRQL